MTDPLIRKNPPTTNYQTEPPECWGCVPIKATTDDNGATTTTHQPDCQHIADQRARFTDQGVTT